MDPDFAAALAHVAANSQFPALTSLLTVEQMRAYFHQRVIMPNKMYHEQRLPLASSYIVKDKHAPGNGGDIIVRCVTPVADNEETFPVLVYIHGGGGCAGSIELDDFYLRRLSVELQLVTVNIEYRLSPENPFPAGIDDCFSALKWVAENARSLNGDLSEGFLIGGHSAGANFAAVLAHMARDDPFFEDRHLTGQLLREPFVVHPEAIPESIRDDYKAMEENKDSPPLPRAAMLNNYKMYDAPPTDPRFAPLLYPSHAGLPPAYIHVMDLDPLRDDGIVYEKALRAAGVKTRIELYPGVSHGFHVNFPSITMAKKVRADLKEGIRWLLGMED